MRTLDGHSSWIMGVALTPDGRRAVSASEDSTLRVWDLESGKEVLRMDGGAPFMCCAVADNKLIFAGDNNGGLHWAEIRNL